MKNFLLLLAVILCATTLKAQSVGIKTNALYWATTTLNMGVEVALGQKTTLDMEGMYNPFEFHGNRKIKGWAVQPEFRYWTCCKFAGHFFGVHAHYAEFNAALKTFRRQGNLVGGGISYGYAWLLGRRWNMEATIGVGYAYMEYERYERPECGSFVDKRYKNYFGPTKVGLSFTYLFR